MMHILRVYWRYYYGKMRGHKMQLWGRPGKARFKCVRIVLPKHGITAVLGTPVQWTDDLSGGEGGPK